MARVNSAPFAVRNARIVFLVAPALLLVANSGCHHKRTSLRPVYGTPVVAPPCNTPGCSTGASTSGGVITNEPAGEVEPNLAPLPSTSRSDGVIRAGAESASGSGRGRASAQPHAANRSKQFGDPTGTIELNRPSALRSTSRIAPASGRSVQVSLRGAVAPFVPEPSDLFQPPKADRPWKYVVVHHSANATGGLDQIDRDHRKVLGFEGCGYHFVIGNGTDSPDGQIEVASRWTNQKNGVHCRNGKNPDVNEYGIGICLVGNFDQSEPTPKQVAAARALVAYLANRYQIPADHLGAHDEFAEGPTACPGQNFPSQAIFGSKHVAAR